MKLKKIASLMLAGVMAVSMLAGCSGKGADDKEENKNPAAPATSNVVTYANDALSADQKEVFTFKSSSDLDTILKDVATNPDKFSSSEIESVFGDFNVRTSVTGDSAAAKTMRDAIVGKLTGIRVDDFKTVPADKASQKVTHVFAVSGAIDEKVAVQKMIGTYASVIDENNFPDALVDSKTKYACDYSAEISAVKVASPEHNEKTAWVVAIVITQNLTKTANASSSTATA